MMAASATGKPSHPMMLRLKAKTTAPNNETSSRSPNSRKYANVKIAATNRCAADSSIDEMTVVKMKFRVFNG